MDLNEALEILDAYFSGRYKSMYLLDAWNYILNYVKGGSK